MAADNRYRNFVTVVYPDSVNQDWINILGELAIPCFVSPLHDKDVNADGTPKKPHWHVMLMFEGKKAPSQAQAIFSLIGGVGMKIVESKGGMARYFCHLDNPEKAQYRPADVIQFGGADYSTVCNLVQDRVNTVKEMIRFCRTQDIVDFASLLEYAEQNEPEWFFALITNCSLVMKEYIKSRSWRKGIR